MSTYSVAAIEAANAAIAEAALVQYVADLLSYYAYERKPATKQVELGYFSPRMKWRVMLTIPNKVFTLACREEKRRKATKPLRNGS